MEHVYVTARSSFVNSLFGSVTRGQRIPLPAGAARELEAMGLVAIEKQPLTVQHVPEQRDPLAAGEGAPSSSSPADQASETTSLPKRKRGRPRKDGA